MAEEKKYEITISDLSAYIGALVKKMGQFINELGMVCEKIVQAAMEE